MIEIVDLIFQYPSSNRVLNQVNLTIQRGEKVALVGPNGAGKSTLLLHLNGILQGEGLVRVDELVMNKANLPRIRSKVGLVFQNPDDQLFSLSVAEDVAFGPIHQGFNPDEVRQRVASALKAVNLTEFGDRHPFHLSGGEKKRASIATVLSMSPDYLVLDEPTSGLDPKSRRELIALLKSLPQAQIIATHDLAMAQELADRVVLLKGGRVVMEGSPRVLLNDHQLLQQNDLE